MNHERFDPQEDDAIDVEFSSSEDNSSTVGGDQSFQNPLGQVT
ncbi:MAG: hypothetical protein RJA81_265, partial [Planctomycetota bacterium]